MKDEQLIDFVLNQLSPSEQAEMESHIAQNAEALHKINRLRLALQPLETDRDAYAPPPGLATATIARVAEYITQQPVAPAPKPIKKPLMRRVVTSGDWLIPSWRRADIAVAAGISFIAFGLLVSALGKIRHASQVYACQNQLREVHVALTGYTETHNGRYPEVGTPAVPVAGAFITELARAGQYESARPLLCPAGDPDDVKPVMFSVNPANAVMKVGYAYSLGYRNAVGNVTGLRRADSYPSVSDGVPIVADLPSIHSSPNDGPTSPHGYGQNILYAGGNVRYSTSSAVGINRDEIYQNDNGLVRAGLHCDDAALGRPSDTP